MRYLVLVLLCPVLFVACGEDDPTAPVVKPDTVTFTVQAADLSVINDCDRFTSTPSAAAGDFYITVRLEDITGSEAVELDRVSDFLVQANDGETRNNMDIKASATFEAVSGTRVIARVSYYELDGGGVKQVSAGTAATYIYNASKKCWAREFEDVCVSANVNDFGFIYLEDFTGDPCDVSLRWVVRVE